MRRLTLLLATVSLATALAACSAGAPKEPASLIPTAVGADSLSILSPEPTLEQLFGLAAPQFAGSLKPATVAYATTEDATLGVVVLRFSGADRTALIELLDSVFSPRAVTRDATAVAGDASWSSKNTAAWVEGDYLVWISDDPSGARIGAARDAIEKLLR